MNSNIKEHRVGLFFFRELGMRYLVVVHESIKVTKHLLADLDQ